MDGYYNHSLLLGHGPYRWRQLAYVTLFYVFFIYIYALMGVQWVGGLSHRCVYVDREMDNR